MIDLFSCPVCNNSELSIKECKFRDKVYGYNVYCSNCYFTGRTYKIKIKALKKWNALVRQNRNIKGD